MKEKIEFKGFVDVAVSGISLIEGELFIHIPKEEAQKVLWCHQRTKVDVTIKPVKKEKDDRKD